MQEKKNNLLICRSLRIAGRSAGSSDSGKSSNSKGEVTAVSTGVKERSRAEPSITHTGSQEPPTLAEAAARLADSAKSSSATTVGYQSRARYLLELDHHVSDDLLQSVLGLLRNHGLSCSCEVAGGSDGDRYILITAPFELLAAQVCI